MFQDIIRNTEIYQYIKQEGLEQGIEQGRLEALRQTLIAFVQARSAGLIPLAQKKAEETDNTGTLNALIRNIGLAQSMEDVRRYLEEVKDK